MGVTSPFLPDIINKAGRHVDLSHYAPGILSSSSPSTSNRRPLRVGIDISQWIVPMCTAHAGKLAEERHLSNEGRAELASLQKDMDDDTPTAPKNGSNQPPIVTKEMFRKLTTSVALSVLNRIDLLRKHPHLELLCVLDGASPPVKFTTTTARHNERKQHEQARDNPVIDQTEADLQKRIKGMERAGTTKYSVDITMAVMEGLRERKIPFLVAPYEADGQLAYLSQKHFIDLIVTEDSDLVCYGAGPILYRMVDRLKYGELTGELVRRQDLAAYFKANLDLTDISPAVLTVLCVAIGCDYIKNLKGIGIVTATKILRDSFLIRLQPGQSPLATFIEGLFAKTNDAAISDDDSKQAYVNNFVEALFMFRHPVIFDPIKGECVHLGDVVNGDPELVSFQPYKELLQDFNRRAQVTGKILDHKLALCIAEGWVCPRSKKFYNSSKTPDSVIQFAPDLAVLGGATLVDDFWMRHPVPTDAEAWMILKLLGYTVSEGVYYLPNDVLPLLPADAVYDFHHLQGLRKFLCRFGIPLNTEIHTSVGMRDALTLERWVRFANVNMPSNESDLQQVDLPHGAAEIKRLLVDCNSAETDDGKNFIPYDLFAESDFETTLRTKIRGALRLQDHFPTSLSNELCLRLWAATSSLDLPKFPESLDDKAASDDVILCCNYTGC
jgi:hypothetical protein